MEFPLTHYMEAKRVNQQNQPQHIINLNIDTTEKLKRAIPPSRNPFAPTLFSTSPCNLRSILSSSLKLNTPLHQD